MNLSEFVNKVPADARQRPQVSRKKDIILRSRMLGDPVANLRTLLYDAHVVPSDIHKCESHVAMSGNDLDDIFDPRFKAFQDLLRRQDEYIEQLEKENSIIKGEIASINNKVRQVVAENYYLINEQKNEPLRSQPTYDSKITSVSKRLSDEEKIIQDRENMVMASYRERLKDLTEDSNKMRYDAGNNINDVEHVKKAPTRNSAIKDDENMDVSNLKAENKNLLQQISRLQDVIVKMKDREEDAQRQIQANISLMERTHFEKVQALTECDNLRRDLEKQQKLIDDLKSEHEKRKEAEHQRYFQSQKASCELAQHKFMDLLTILTSMEANLKEVKLENRDLHFELKKAQNQVEIFHRMRKSQWAQTSVPLEPRDGHGVTLEENKQIDFRKKLEMANKQEQQFKELENVIQMQITIIDHFKSECQRLLRKMNKLLTEN